METVSFGKEFLDKPNQKDMAYLEIHSSFKRTGYDYILYLGSSNASKNIMINSMNDSNCSLDLISLTKEAFHKKVPYLWVQIK